MTVRRISLPLLVVLALAGCANGSDDPAPAANSPGPVANSPAAPSIDPSPPTASAGPKTITGTVTAGVEPDCLLLDDHLLLIQDAKLKSAAKVGATITATGRVEPGMMTTCQQGTPFVVTSLRAN
jgi:hypothetical protein